MFITCAYDSLVLNLISLDFIDFNICINYIKEKQANKRRFEANRTSDVLELIFIDICGPFLMVAWNS